MAGGDEDCIDFQADCLPTGSVSFGRFEVETLSWERRSSFSHNRYLEEVEKYSTPGSVTQKRAILEAHFKKKPLLPQTSLESMYAGGCQTTQNGSSHHKSYENEFEDHDDSCIKKNKDHDDRGDPQFDQYDPTGSEQHEVIECEQEEISLSESSAEHIWSNDERIVDPNYRSDDEILQDSAPQNELYIVSEEEPDNKAVIVEELLEKKESMVVEEILEKRNISSDSTVAEKMTLPNLKKKMQAAPLRVKGVEQKTTNRKQKNEFSIQQNLKKSSVEGGYTRPGKMVAKSMGKLERDNAPRLKSVSRYLMPSISKSTKLETSVNMTAKVRQGTRSEKDVKAKKSAIAAHSSSERSEKEVCNSANRPRGLANSANKEETRQSAPVFKSEERAEKRKEYFMKLEEKLHAKEAEIGAIQARTQEETEAAIRKFRRSLNFKATPMPSFYHEAVPQISASKKKVTTVAKPEKLQSMCTTSGSQTSRERSPSISKPSNIESQSNSESNHASASAKTKSTGIQIKDGRSNHNIEKNSSRMMGEHAIRVGRGAGNAIVGKSAGTLHVAS